LADAGAPDSSEAAAAAIVMTYRMWLLMAAYNTRHADRHRGAPAHFRARRQPEFPRVVGLLRRQRVRSAPRARIQRDSKRRSADRRLAALHVHRQRPRRGERSGVRPPPQYEGRAAEAG